MNELVSMRGIFDSPVTRWCVGAVVAALVLTPILTGVLGAMGRLSPATRRDVWVRYRTWLFIAPAALLPILAAPLGAMLLVLAISLLCYREFARATGLFRERLLSGIVALGIVLLTLASIDHWHRLFVALQPLTITVLAGAAVLADRPSGYLQRVSLAAVGFLLFGAGLGHLGFLANLPEYRPVLCMLLVCVQASDILAYVCGKAFGKRRLFVNTSPNKTLGGHLGALVLVAPLAAWLAHHTFPGTPLDRPLWLGLFGVLVAVGAQLGDLVLGSIKRDLGVKDLAVSLPGHGGFTDRCNSLLLVAPAAYHYMDYFLDLDGTRAVRVFTGG